MTPSAFRHAHQLEASLGLVPREYSSGETQRRGPITKAGHSRTRWLLIQAAVSILRRHPPQAEALRTWALRIAARRGKQVAVVASPGGLPASSMPCSATAPSSSPTGCASLVPPAPALVNG
jgi:transposase